MLILWFLGLSLALVLEAWVANKFFDLNSDYALLFFVMVPLPTIVMQAITGLSLLAAFTKYHIQPRR
jgi:hypothetical protein